MKYKLKRYLAYAIGLTVGIPVALVFCLVACCLIVFDRFFGIKCNIREV